MVYALQYPYIHTAIWLRFPTHDVHTFRIVRTHIYMTMLQSETQPRPAVYIEMDHDTKCGATSTTKHRPIADLLSSFHAAAKSFIL